MKAASSGASEVGLHVYHEPVAGRGCSWPLTVMGGIVGRLFHEFTITLTVAIMISLVILADPRRRYVRPPAGPHGEKKAHPCSSDDEGGSSGCRRL